MDEPIDLRLVPAALAVWLVAAFVVVLRSDQALLAGLSVAGLLGLLPLVGPAARRAVGRASTRRPPVVVDGRSEHGRHRRPDRPEPGGGQQPLVLGAVCVLLLASAAQLACRERGDLRAVADESGTVHVSGIVRSAPRPVTGSSTQVRVLVVLLEVARPGATAVPAGAPLDVIGSGDVWSGLVYGDRVEVDLRLSAQPDRARRAVARGRPAGTVHVVPVRSPVLRAAARLRSGLREVTAGVPGDAGGLLPAVAVGDVRDVDDLDEPMRGSGLAHLTAVSGAHFSMLGALVLGCCGWAGVPRRWRWPPTALVLVGFVVVVQPGASVVRAAVMGAVGLVGLAAGRPARSVPALACAVLVLLVVDPWLARDVGFVLSVVATAGITTLAAPMAARWEPWLGRTGALAVAVPCAAQAACAPVVLVLTPAVSSYAVLANLLVAPAVAPATLLGLLAAVLAPAWPSAAGWAAALAGAACWWIARVARTTVTLPGAQIAWAGGAAGMALLTGATAALLVLVLSAGHGTLGSCLRLPPPRPVALLDRVRAALRPPRGSPGTRRPSRRWSWSRGRRSCSPNGPSTDWSPRPGSTAPRSR
ncbi:MAG TPA: ComEC/Rec2 family competence protein [Cellulomonas sp.]